MKDAFEALLAEMPRIAEAANAFKSEQVQREVVQALVRALVTESDEDTVDAVRDARSAEDGAESEQKSSKPAAKKATAKKSASKSQPSGSAATKKSPSKSRGSKSSEPTPKILADIDLHPKGGKSFKDFVNDKAPESNFEKILVAVYYLQNEGGVTGITVDHVWTCFKNAGWRTPAMPRDYIRQTANKKGWLDLTGGPDDIKVSIAGDNYILHELPKAQDQP